jgi:hypothetical protein
MRNKNDKKTVLSSVVRTKKNVGVSATRAHFVRKLYSLLGNKTNEDVVRWAPALDSFLILKPQLFATKILPVYFNHCKIESFERQMNFYGYVVHNPLCTLTYSPELTNLVDLFRFKKMGIHDDQPSRKRLRKGQPIKFKHANFGFGREDRLHTITRKTCPKHNEQTKARVQALRREVASFRSYNQKLKRQLKDILISHM